MKATCLANIGPAAGLALADGQAGGWGGGG